MERFELQAIQDMIAAGDKFDGKNYPELQGKHPGNQDVTYFAIRHSLHHMQKGIGRIAEYVEKVEHGGPMEPGDNQFLDEIVKKEFVNVLRLAEVLGITADDLMFYAAEKYMNR